MTALRRAFPLGLYPPYSGRSKLLPYGEQKGRRRALGWAPYLPYTRTNGGGARLEVDAEAAEG